jgi:hypothetical protein
MKQLLFLILLTFFSLSAFSQNEHSIDRRFIVKLNPLGTFAAVVPVSMEYFISPRFSAGLNGTYQNFTSGSLDNTLEQEGYGGGPEIRYYFVQTEKTDYFSKVYLAAFYHYERIDNYSEDRFGNEYPGLSTGSSAGVVFGHQFFFKSRFVMDIYAGPAYSRFFKNENYDQNITKSNMFMAMANARSSGTKVKIGFSLGIRF